MKYGHRFLAIAAVMGIAALSLTAQAQTVDPAEIERLRQLIEQQQVQIEAQAKMLKELQGQVEQLATSTAQASESANQAAKPADAPLVTKSGKEGVKLTVSGQVNRAAMFFSDGDESDVAHVDNDNSSTRIRFVGKGSLTDDVSVGAQIEVQFESNSTGDVTQLDTNGIGDGHFTERKLEFYLDSKTLGRLWVGQGDTASNGTSERDLSGVGVLMYSAIRDFAGGLLFRRDDTGALSATDIGDAFDNFDGRSRDDRIRYDTPKFSGFQLSTSHISNDDGEWDVAGRYSGSISGTKLAAAVAYSQIDGLGRVSGSFSALHSSGINLTFAAGTDEKEDAIEDEEFYYVKLGYLSKFLTDMGNTGVAVDYFHGEDQETPGSESDSIGVGFVQHVDKIATEFYLGFRWHDFEEPFGTDGFTGDYDSIWAVLAGARIKF